jgi:hypothetical protein
MIVTSKINRGAHYARLVARVQECYSTTNNPKQSKKRWRGGGPEHFVGWPSCLEIVKKVELLLPENKKEGHGKHHWLYDKVRISIRREIWTENRRMIKNRFDIMLVLSLRLSNLKKKKEKKKLYYTYHHHHYTITSGTGKVTLNGHRIITISQFKDKIYSRRKRENFI